MLKYLLKWRFEEKRRGASWRNKIKTARRAIEDLPSGSPSLKPKLPELLSKAYARAHSDAVDEMKLNRKQAERLPESCPWRFEEFTNSDFWPERRATVIPSQR